MTTVVKPSISTVSSEGRDTHKKNSNYITHTHTHTHTLNGSHKPKFCDIIHTHKRERNSKITINIIIKLHSKRRKY